MEKLCSTFKEDKKFNPPLSKGTEDVSDFLPVIHLFNFQLYSWCLGALLKESQLSLTADDDGCQETHRNSMLALMTDRQTHIHSEEVILSAPTATFPLPFMRLCKVLMSLAMCCNARIAQ